MQSTNTRTRYYNHTCVCEECGSTFYASRYDAKFCPAPKTCRQDYNRKQKQRERKFERAMRAFSTWETDTIKSGYLTASEARQLLNLKRSIVDILNTRDYQLALPED